jgi:small-conductance mechanosensitive channel
MLTSSFFSQTFSKDFILWIESAFAFAFILFIGVFFKKYLAKFAQGVFAKIGLGFSDRIVVLSGSYISFWSLLIALYFSFLIAPINTNNLVIHKIFYVIFAFSIVVLIASILSRFFRKSVHERIGANLLKFGIIFIGLVLILNQAGIKLTPILTALGIGSVAVALALQDTLANFFAGINIIASKQISRNDYIKLDSGQEGTVLEVNWRTTLIREISNTVIVVPNSKVSSSIVTSFHFKMAEVSVSVECGVAYGSDLEHVERIAKLAAKEVIDKSSETVKAYEPTVYFTRFSDYSIDFILYFRVKNIYSKKLIQSEVLKNIYKKFNEEKIEIPFPQRIVTINK